MTDTFKIQHQLTNNLAVKAVRTDPGYVKMNIIFIRKFTKVL